MIGIEKHKICPDNLFFTANCNWTERKTLFKPISIAVKEARGFTACLKTYSEN